MVSKAQPADLVLPRQGVFTCLLPSPHQHNGAGNCQSSSYVPTPLAKMVKKSHQKNTQ